MCVNSSSTVQAMTTDADPAGRSRTSRAKAVSIAAIPPLMSQAPRPYIRPPLDVGPERVDRHPVGRDGVLVGVEEDRPSGAGDS